MSIDAAVRQLRLQPRVSEARFHFEDQVFVRFPQASVLVIPLVGLVEDVDLLNIGGLSTLGARRLKKQSELFLGQVGWYEPLLRFAGGLVT